MSFRRRMMMAANAGGSTDTIMTIESNPQVLAVCYAQGWCASDRYMTETEAAAVTDVGTVFRNNTSITHFEEFAYFTGVTSIADYAFSNCYYLLDISIPDNVTTIGVRAFSGTGWMRLKHITIGRNVTTFGTDAFAGCHSLKKIRFNGKRDALANGNYGLFGVYVKFCEEFESDVYDVIDGVLYDGTILLAYPVAKVGASFTTPSFVTIIYARAFDHCNALQNLIINEGVTSLGANALQLSNLRTLDLPSTLKTIGEGCMYQMNYIYSITSRAMTAPNTSATHSLQNLGSSTSETKIIYIPSGATGYSSGEWATLQSNGWTLETIS